MKTTEIFIEQVLIGSIVLAFAALPLHPEIVGTMFAAGGNSSTLVKAWPAGRSCSALFTSSEWSSTDWLTPSSRPGKSTCGFALNPHFPSDANIPRQDM